MVRRYHNGSAVVIDASTSSDLIAQKCYDKKRKTLGCVSVVARTVDDIRHKFLIYFQHEWPCLDVSRPQNLGVHRIVRSLRSVDQLFRLEVGVARVVALACSVALQSHSKNVSRTRRIPILDAARPVHALSHKRKEVES
mmetsp:Transcript_39294/g.63813  ORF Transcript_39294/g.63813 Transcript_39294/m.63813 type:complete len:139 (-) Transcript_39294:494-910(-)